MFNKIIDALFFFNRTPQDHYSALKRNIIIIMLLITTLPLATMIIINYFQYKSHLRNQIIAPLFAMADKTRHSFDLFLDQRLAIIRFISTTYNFEDLSNEQNIKKVLISIKKEWSGFVDIGLINGQGDLVSYAGPYSLLGKNYSEQLSFQETQIKGHYISNVFLGFRKYPHIVMAVQHLTDDGQTWILRATIDTDFFDSLISSMGLPRQTDAFLINRDGILQTNSLYYGNTLEKCPLELPRVNFKSNSIEGIDDKNQAIFLVASPFSIASYILVIVWPQSVALQSWYALKTEMIIIFFISLAIIIFAVLKMTHVLITRIKTSDEHRENVLTELQHAQKLSSIGRLSAGVAHEINNPLAIINEKAGLMSDLIELSKDFNEKTKFIELTDAILNSVKRCKKITHRLLGFSKRIDIKIEPININHIIHEVLDFLEKDILYRKIEINLLLSESLASIHSDQGLIQQILVNLLTNAFAAVEEYGRVEIETHNLTDGRIILKISDNGCGIPKDVIKNIFDPFFTTKKEKGTGLGLSITYGIIKKLGGEISVSSKPGEGSVFSIELPDKPTELEVNNE
ncbi:MAG: two-component sensor histidine kinase [Proteobacteria bacterium]|nr:two-component sensor histidine kinase [Pseudomonadota bacterium]MBU1583526.1 two-component sensor histidine kinase [Pseudomonadota bacterium]MBU2454974.1 two-component sensor histidine kinase [Pseudomonadota bacterium]MBU2631095.1 two-component sensor histidine kinase [Pseudomonadota bacterium]